MQNTAYPNQNRINPPLSSATTGKQQIYLKSNQNGIKGNIYSNLNDPITGQSQKQNVDINMRNINSNMNMGYQQPLYTNTNQNQYMNQNTNLHPNLNTNLNTNFNPNLNPNLNTYNNMNTMNQNDNIINQPIIHDKIQQQKGKIKQRGNTIKTHQQYKFKDPITGQYGHGEINSKVRGDRSLSGKKATTTYQTKNNGQETIIQGKHKQGGIMSNLKNKLHNLMHR